MSHSMRTSAGTMTFADDIAKVDDTEALLSLRYELVDTFLGRTGYDEGDDSARDKAVRGLVRVIEAEVGGRWVR